MPEPIFRDSGLTICFDAPEVMTYRPSRAMVPTRSLEPDTSDYSFSKFAGQCQHVLLGVQIAKSNAELHGISTTTESSSGNSGFGPKMPAPSAFLIIAADVQCHNEKSGCS